MRPRPTQRAGVACTRTARGIAIKIVHRHDLDPAGFGEVADDRMENRQLPPIVGGAQGDLRARLRMSCSF